VNSVVDKWWSVRDIEIRLIPDLNSKQVATQDGFTVLDDLEAEIRGVVEWDAFN
jgi:hypothetical protein